MDARVKPAHDDLLAGADPPAVDCPLRVATLRSLPRLRGRAREGVVKRERVAGYILASPYAVGRKGETQPSQGGGGGESEPPHPTPARPPLRGRQFVGWVERSETHLLIRGKAMGFARAQPILQAIAPRSAPRLDWRLISTRLPTLDSITQGVGDAGPDRRPQEILERRSLG
jgi:hypothetical protein